MKILFKLSIWLILLIFSATCSGIREEGIEVTGTIKEQGFTTYQYGTHTLTSAEDFYAIKSDSIDLNLYLNKEVTVKASKIEGYPVDGGPVYLEILEIR